MKKEVITLMLLIDEIFKKLKDEKQMEWTDVMSGLVEWAASKYGDEVGDVILLEKYPTFVDIVNAYYTELSLTAQAEVNAAPIVVPIIEETVSRTD
jgi:hypothetical protein